MKTILGLDLGTNSVGWALIDKESNKIIDAGSRILPMDGETLGKYEKGNMDTPASIRTGFRGIRRLYERAKLRRERLLRVLHVMGFLPKHFEQQIDFDIHPGQFKNNGEPLLPYRPEASGRNHFIFTDSFLEMADEFHRAHASDQYANVRIPHDWTIYYLRHKALTQPIRREELAWILLQFNTKRGYYQLRGEEEEASSQASKKTEYMVLTVASVEKGEPDKKGYYNYTITYENGATQSTKSITDPRNVGDRVELIVTTTFDKDGNIAKSKDGKLKIVIRTPKDDDWTLKKKRTEAEISGSQQTVGDYIYHTLLRNPETKIRGNEVGTIDRIYYKEELKKILANQAEFMPELRDSKLLEQCVRELYHNNEAHVASLQGKTFIDFLVDDILFYQRSLRSKKNLIANCPLEKYYWVDKETGEEHQVGIKVIPKSHPLYQEFRIRQFMQNLKVIRKETTGPDGKRHTDVDVTRQYLNSPADWQHLYEFLSGRASVSNKDFCKFLGLSESDYRWNYPTDNKTYPCAETHCLINAHNSLDKSEEIALWHIMYSVSDPIELRKALTTFAAKHGLDVDAFVKELIHTKPFADDYGAFSEKALRKLLPFMRIGTDWHEEDLPQQAKSRMQEIIDGTEGDRVRQQLADNHLQLHSPSDFNNLPLWLAQYLVYGEKDDFDIWQSPKDIDNYLRTKFRQSSLRNPIVEAVLGETLRVVRDVWQSYGRPAEIHVEMGRDLKQPNDKRAKATERMRENEATNIRIRALLQELANDPTVEDVRPHSPSQLELLKIYETDVLANYDQRADEDDIMSIVSSLGKAKGGVSHNDIIRYKCWLEQRYLSPYTGDPIPLSKLFTPAYEIEHIIPQSRYFDDSLNNKVICERAVNRLKGNMLGYEFILKEHGHIVGGHQVMEPEAYARFVDDHYAHNLRKKRNLLREDIPSSFINRQLNDSRYIARKTSEILSAVVRTTNSQGRAADNDRGSVSINVIATNGSITDMLKREWGLTQVWSHIIAPRFIRLNEKLQTDAFGHWVCKEGKRYFQTEVPLELSEGFSKKRIDHRHHALDAIVIACTTRSHVNYISNSSAEGKRYDLRQKLCFKDKTNDLDNYSWRFTKPWPTFTEDAKRVIEGIIVSFKQDLRVITKTSNHYWHYENGRKVLVRQTKGDDWALRKSLHKATVSGAVWMQKKTKVRLQAALDNWHMIVDKQIRQGIKKVIEYQGKTDKKALLSYFKAMHYKLGTKDIAKVEVWCTPQKDEKPEWAASRTRLGDSFDSKTIEKVTDSGIRKILSNHLAENGNDPKIAFSPEGIARMNESIRRLNGGKDHKPIYSVRKMEALGMKFPIGERGAKSKKYVEADKGTNLFFAIYADADGKRSYRTIAYNEAVERKKQALPVAPATDNEGRRLLFVLSPGDLVYMPDEGEHVGANFNPEKIWKCVSSSGNRAAFIPERVATIIADKKEYDSQNKVESDDYGRSIKAFCHKLTVDRLGRITKTE